MLIVVGLRGGVYCLLILLISFSNIISYLVLPQQYNRQLMSLKGHWMMDLILHLNQRNILGSIRE